MTIISRILPTCIISCLSLCAFVAACTAGSDEPAGASSKQPTAEEVAGCNAYCAKRSTCFPEDEEEACVADCASELANLRAGLSGECGTAHLDRRSCLGELSCDEFMTYPNRCHEEGDTLTSCMPDICVQHCEREASCVDPDAFLPCEEECTLLYTLGAIDAPDCIQHYDGYYACLSGFDCADPARDEHCASELEAFGACGFMVSASDG